ncbi:hypothetical protein MNB_SV-14-1399 [hydrothermal vent metagenome]|uniref:Uncharacterized protein n=1 Tax=hydrothermal vent metagenome TaxID=652676 RepID=A0A1W1BXR5_9ZZZZ
MPNRQYVTITHYKEREFYFLNHAIQTEDGFIPKEIEQFHESEKEKFIEHIRFLQSQYLNTQIASISLSINQVVSDKEDKNKVSAKIFNNNFAVQDKMDIGNIPTTLYFSPFAILYEEYKKKLDNKLTLLIGYFDRKLYMMFATKDKIHQSWVIGTRGLSEKQIALRVYKSMKAYYKISYKFADHIEMLLTDDSPKLLKVLREELSLTILPTQNSIHNLLHHMAGEQSRASSSYIRSSLSAEHTSIANDLVNDYSLAKNNTVSHIETRDNLENLKLNESFTSSSIKKDISFFNKLKSLFLKKDSSGSKVKSTLLAFVPFLFVLGLGGYYTLENKKELQSIQRVESQIYAQTNNALLANTSKNIFSSMGKNAELKNALISNSMIKLKGIVWGIEPLRKSLEEFYPNGKLSLTPLEDFTTEFSFKSKV